MTLETKYMYRVSILDRGDGVTRLWWANGYWQADPEQAVLMSEFDANQLIKGSEFAWKYPRRVEIG